MSFKVVHKDDTKRVQNLPTSYAEVLNGVKKVLGDKCPAEFTLRYIDQDGDSITINSEDDFKIMKEIVKDNIKIFVVPVEEMLAPLSPADLSDLNSPRDDLIPIDEPIAKQETAEPSKKERNEKLKAAKKAAIKSVKFEILSVQEHQTKLQAEQLECTESLMVLRRRMLNDKKTPELKTEIKAEKMRLKATLGAIKSEMEELTLRLKELSDKLQRAKGKPLKNRGQESVVHSRVTCDGCGVGPIRGIRYKCTVCHDFDYCEKCEATIEHPHCFIRIRAPHKAPKFILCADEKPEYLETELTASTLDQLQGIVNKFQIPIPMMVPNPPAPVQEVPQTQTEADTRPDSEGFQEMRSDAGSDIQAVPEQPEEKKEETPAPAPEATTVTNLVAAERLENEVREKRIAYLMEMFPQQTRGRIAGILRAYPMKTDEELIEYFLE
jgi:hypothetical protein